ncbi:glycine receptor subunit alpha-2 [Plakobranchus ocellatus]|uniref:Glycine receptor subunit alpha-2 n=1 Tax=Plakobranchus ocellatus TaxID=259542 RepID=A0AAV3ZNR5_9GAST|nr:glycine receptor subunit alpha-2 [Plakobranchus ocellatus]
MTVSYLYWVRRQDSDVGCKQSILRRLLHDAGLVYDARVPPNFEDNYATKVSVQIYVVNFDSLTEISMVNSWWGLPSTIRASIFKESPHPPRSHFLHHYRHPKPRHHNYHYLHPPPPHHNPNHHPQPSHTGTLVSDSIRRPATQGQAQGATRGAAYDSRLRRTHNTRRRSEGDIFRKESRREIAETLAWEINLEKNAVEARALLSIFACSLLTSIPRDNYFCNKTLVSTTSMSKEEYSMSIFLRMRWVDERLKWNESNIEDQLEVDPKLTSRIWAPDLYFLNEKEAIVHDVTVLNKLMQIHKNGTIDTSTRISMTLSCDMHLERYPHDEQTCSIYAGSYSYSKENVELSWHHNPLELRPGLTLPRFTIKGYTTKTCDHQSFGTESIISGNFSCIEANFYLRRQFGYYIVQVYIPSVLIVMLSWVSFWIDLDATPARVSLGLLTVLAISTQSSGEKSALPRVSYIKALDLWLAVCLMFVFLALLEFSYVHVQCRVEKRRQDSILVETSSEPGQPSNGKDSYEYEPGQRSGRRFVFLRDRMKVKKVRHVDKFSRIAFPVAFLFFNIAYWVYYQ